MIGIFWEMTSGCFLFSALHVSTVDTYSASVHGCFWKNLFFHVTVNPVPEVAARTWKSKHCFNKQLL